ncbi:MAG: dihydrodipicolinate reductase [Pseudomonadota bacterium]
MLTRDAFVTLVQDRALTRMGIALDVSGGGVIEGRAFGRPVTGDWEWRDRYFCRTLYFGQRDLGANCQTVEVRGDTLRFTLDQGRGDFADLTLR